MSSPPRGDFGAASSGFGSGSPFRGSPFIEEDNPFADLASSRVPPPISVLPTAPISPPPVSSDPFASSAPPRSTSTNGSSTPTRPSMSASTPSLQPSTRASPQSSRRRPTTSRLAQSVVSRLEELDLESDPLGPLGGSSTSDTVAPPPPPAKDDTPTPVRSTQKQPAMTFSELKVDVSDLPSRLNERSPSIQRQLSMPLEQAAQPPSFHITVGDPTTIGNITGSHTEYKVRTRTNSKAFKNEDFTVNRRYRDFVWLYTALNNNNPGIVVPPPPEKQQLGRFQDEFVEARRTALERMLNKIAQHPVLQRDVDFKLFIESDAFNADVKQREKANAIAGDSKGFMGSIGLGSYGGKIPEADDWFEDRKTYVDELEKEFKSWSKAIDTIVKQRKDLAEATGEFGNSLFNLSGVELDASLCNALADLADLQAQIKELHDRQAQQDVLTLGNTVEEYIRTIGSIKTAFGQRAKVYSQLQAAEADFQKRQSYLDKVKRQAKTQQDRLAQMNADLADAEKRCHQLRLEFEETGKRLKLELERFEREKVEDFKASVETFLEASVEGQKELIEIWETYLMRVGADLPEDDNLISAEPVVQGNEAVASS